MHKEKQVGRLGSMLWNVIRNKGIHLKDVDLILRIVLNSQVKTQGRHLK